MALAAILRKNKNTQTVITSTNIAIDIESFLIIHKIKRSVESMLILILLT